MNTRKNQHYQSTHRQIQQALRTLLEQYDLQQITVRQICENAGINRSTFYTHYPSLFDLWNDLESILRIGQMEYFMNANIQLTAFLSVDGLVSILQYMYDHRNFYRSYLKVIGTAEYIRSAFEELWESNWHDRFWDQSMPKEYMYHAFHFFVTGAIGLFLLWLNDDCEDEISQRAKDLYSFMPDILKTASSCHTKILPRCSC